jgi:DNA-binding IclR family transcriptional regulator
MEVPCPSHQVPPAAWRLASPQPAEERWSIGAEGVEKIRKALDGSRFLELADTLNRARGADAAYTVRLEALEGGRRHAVLAYKLGSPSPPVRFLKLVERFRGILTAGGRYPAAHAPS